MKDKPNWRLGGKFGVEKRNIGIKRFIFFMLTLFIGLFIGMVIPSQHDFLDWFKMTEAPDPYLSAIMASGSVLTLYMLIFILAIYATKGKASNPKIVLVILGVMSVVGAIITLKAFAPELQEVISIALFSMLLMIMTGLIVFFMLTYKVTRRKTPFKGI